MIQHGKPDKTFKYGTREFTAKRSPIGILVRDIPKEFDPSVTYSKDLAKPLPEQLEWGHIDDYLKKFEEEERVRCKRINLSLLNDGEDDDEDEFGDIAEEFDDDRNIK